MSAVDVGLGGLKEATVSAEVEGLKWLEMDGEVAAAEILAGVPGRVVELEVVRTVAAVECLEL